LNLASHNFTVICYPLFNAKILIKNEPNIRIDYEKTCFILQKSSSYYDERIKFYEREAEKYHSEALAALKQDNKLSKLKLINDVLGAKNLII
jgi:hypothetical protein